MDFKKLLLILCLFVGLNTVAQNRLEFNQVVTIDTTIVGNSVDFYYTDTYTVPANKVAKIEMAKINNYSYGYGNILVNGVKSNALDGSSILINTPIWLKSGDTFKCGGRKYNTNIITYYIHISIIEFNIVQ